MSQCPGPSSQPPALTPDPSLRVFRGGATLRKLPAHAVQACWTGRGGEGWGEVRKQCILRIGLSKRVRNGGGVGRGACSKRSRRTLDSHAASVERRVHPGVLTGPAHCRDVPVDGPTQHCATRESGNSMVPVQNSQNRTMEFPPRYSGTTLYKHLT